MIPRLHLVTDDEILLRDDFPAQALGALEAGGDRIALHLRGPAAKGRFLFGLAVRLLGSVGSRGSTLLVNDRVDLALALPGLSGVHLGQRSLPAEEARVLLGPRRVLGLSVHSSQEVQASLAGVLDYLVVGAIYATSSHPGRVPGGATRVRELAGTVETPLIGIGGITLERVQEVVRAGAEGVAVRSGVWDGPDPARAVSEYLSALDRCADTRRDQPSRYGDVENLKGP